jgi:DNA-binding SARP family transcriptional activator
MATLTVRLFGRFGLWCDNQPASGLGARRAREVLSYLLLYPDHPHRREKLADLLWEETPPALARKYLRQALWQIQARLQHGRDARLEVDPEWIQLHSRSDLQVDVHSFQAAIGQCHGTAGAQLDPAQCRLLEEAVGVYRADLLEGWEQGWCLAERERLRGALLDALDKLVTWCAARCDCERGLAHARRMLVVDPAREQAYCHIMRLQVLAGNRTEALRTYQRCERLLMQELDVKPSAATQALDAAIRDGSCEALRDGAGTDGAAPHHLSALADHLAHIRATLAQIEARLRHETRAQTPESHARDTRVL